MRGSTLIKTLTAAGIATMLTAACSGGGSDDAGSDGGEGGGKVTIWASIDAPVMEGMKKGIEPMTSAEGIEIDWQRVDNINQLVMTKIQANDTPDIAFIPQPGVVADIVSRGAAVPLDDVVPMSDLKSTMLPGSLEAGTIDGKLYGMLVSANGKSFVFYPKKAFDAAGYEEPTTIAELDALTEKIKADKSATAPWCLAIGSEAATGWPATDWFEDLVARYGGADGYNQWVKHDIKFDSPLVREAAGQFEKIAFTDGNVLGGRKNIASNQFGTAGNPMFDAQPGCMMMKMGSFITNFFPENVQANMAEEVGVFYFPPVEADGEKPFIGGGDLAVLLNDTEPAKKVMAMLASPKVGEPAINTSTFVSPHKTTDVALYGGGINEEIAQIMYDSSVFLFDGSDQMPGAVGAGTFWKDITAWISGQQDLDTTLKNIDNSWPAS